MNASTFSLAFFDAPQPSTTQEIVPANTLQPGTNYLLALFFTSSSGVPNTNSLLEVNSQTRVLFSTESPLGAAPEPAGASLSAVGIAALLWLRGAIRARIQSGARTPHLYRQ